MPLMQLKPEVSLTFFVIASAVNRRFNSLNSESSLQTSFLSAGDHRFSSASGQLAVAFCITLTFYYNFYRIKRQDKIPDSEVLRRASILSIHTLLQKAQLRWAGHVVRMPDSRLPKQLLYGELSKRKRSAGGQKERCKDSLKVSVKSFGICENTWESLQRVALHGVQEL